MGCGRSNEVKELIVIKKPKEGLERQSFFIMKDEKHLSDNYLVKNKLGEGSFGVVRRIIDRKSGEEKAVKVIKKVVRDKAQEDKLTSEINILSQVDHPCIIKMYEYYQDKKNFYIITEVVKGGELFEKIIDINQFREIDAAYIFNQVISVVQYIHENKIMHRDLKPENIMLEYNPNSKEKKFEIKVVDWGSATKFTDQRETAQIGSPYYIPPEVISKSYTEKCDIWTCGVLLYIMLSGEPPFFGTSIEIVRQITDMKIDMSSDIWKEISNPCKDLIRKMLCPEAERLTAKQVQEHEWVHKYVAMFKDQSKETEQERKECIRHISKLRRFTTKNQLHSAVLQFVSQHLTSKEDLLELKVMFEKMDKDNNGSLSRDEIEQGFKQYYEYFRGDYDIEHIFKSLDQDSNNVINYSEFITASIQSDLALSDKKLTQAFQACDNDGNGFISYEELQGIFLFNLSDKEDKVNSIMSMFDTNKDGQINFEEFKCMMKKFADNY